MLKPLYGQNWHRSTPRASRQAATPGTTFVSGDIIKLVNGKAALATAPADGLGSEFVFEETNRTLDGVVPTLTGAIEAITDRYKTDDTIADRDLLVTRNGLLSKAADAGEQALAIAQAIGAPVGGKLTFKRIRF